MIRLPPLIVLGLCALAGPSLAQTQTRPATGSIVIERALTVSGVRPMTFKESGREIDAVSGSEISEAIIEVTGDPGRVYRVRLPAAIEADGLGSTIDSFTLRSDNSGDISETLTARMDAHGFDRLHVGGQLRRTPGLVITEVSAAIPLSIDYE
ncbi:DUF4402 domain-containing protein [Brevundimonas sp. NIBR11]|uniref:DUF4402 domain-containing protein n=1 Tax=Brevundimonas sp. NIBR11 TaxID=3015999 RepID=UPI0022F12585|nr:DUF4402 domain-containing protein [Brevundimonas sp. NIBR11]WGM31853.1 hypothetical protein KKHFBJBL_02103 [Brevundimonas sp. NIBR11]